MKSDQSWFKSILAFARGRSRNDSCDSINPPMQTPESAGNAIHEADMQTDYTVIAPAAISRDELKHVVRVLGGGWLDSGGRDEGIITEADESITIRVLDPATVASTTPREEIIAAVQLSPRKGPSAGSMALNIARALARRWNGSVLGAPVPRPRPAFTYFEAPVEQMSNTVDEDAVCSLCGGSGLCFELEFADCPELDEEDREQSVGCAQCLKAGRFGWNYRGLDVGSITPNGISIDSQVGISNEEQPSPAIPPSALEEMRRTPDFVTWQENQWLTHCNDFMVYLGAWEPQDFHDRSPSGDGRDLFSEMTADDDQYWWEHRSNPGERGLERWYCTYHTFRCRHCGKLRGYADFP